MDTGLRQVETDAPIVNTRQFILIELSEIADALCFKLHPRIDRNAIAYAQRGCIPPSLSQPLQFREDILLCLLTGAQCLGEELAVDANDIGYSLRQ